MAIETSDLETNLLEFVGKSFGFERDVPVGSESILLFHRSETETESRFRPKVIDLWIAVPREWVRLDVAGEALVLAREGESPAPRVTKDAVEVAAEAEQFTEQGIEFHRTPVEGRGFLYAPTGRPNLTGPEGPGALGLVR